MDNKTWEVVIIGGGPAGYTAAIYTARARLATLVFTGKETGGQLMKTTEVENFPGFSKGIMGPDLMMEMMEQAKRFGAEMRMEEVIKVDFVRNQDNEFGLKKIYVGNEEILARTVIAATGAGARMLGLGEEKLLGRGVSVCAVCDAAFFRDKVTYVVGGGDAAVEDAMALAKFAREVNLVVRRKELRASKIMQERLQANQKIKILWESEVIRVQGDDELHSIELKNSRTQELKLVEADGLFLAIGHIPKTKLFEGQLALDEKGFLKTGFGEYPTQTSVDGVFGAGDVADWRYKQAITAAGMGCQSALDAEKYLMEK